MPCYSPIAGAVCQDGRFHTSYREKDVVRFVSVSCGQCVGCRLERSRQWAIRCLHEASLYKNNCFITLTFSPDCLPKDNSLDYIYFQNFMKRLRESHKGCDQVSHPYAGQVNKKSGKVCPDFYHPIRFYMCGEYGENRGRPHFHACLFNFDFMDKKVWRKTKQGHVIWRSADLEQLWPFGFSEIGSVNFQSAAYVARYIMKKVTGKHSEDAYVWIDPVTGEVFNRCPEFTKMSLKPGIGEGWLKKYQSDVYPHDYVVVNGHKCKPPRYYDRKYMDWTSDDYEVEEFLSDGRSIGFSHCRLSADFEELQIQRHLSALERLEDNTPERLYVKETVALEKVSRLKRSLT